MFRKLDKAIITSRINNNLLKRYDGMTNTVDASDITSVNNRYLNQEVLHKRLGETTSHTRPNTRTVVFYFFGGGRYEYCFNT